jgi:ophiobolin F synthase
MRGVFTMVCQTVSLPPTNILITNPPTDACEELPIAAAHHLHLDLAAAMDVEHSDTDSDAYRALDSDTRSLRTKQLVSAAVLECIKVDRAGAMRMLDAYRKKWLRIMETYNTEEIGDVEGYFGARAGNGGMGYALNIKLSLFRF